MFCKNQHSTKGISKIKKGDLVKALEEKFYIGEDNHLYLKTERPLPRVEHPIPPPETTTVCVNLWRELREELAIGRGIDKTWPWLDEFEGKLPDRKMSLKNI